MEAFLVSTAVVALGEIGDKTQLLALVLAARFQRPLPIIAGILVATSPTTRSPASSATCCRAMIPAESCAGWWRCRSSPSRCGR